MADDYPLIYHNQGATEFVVQSSGLFSMDGTMEVDGTITIADGGYMAYPVVTDTTAANLSNYGVSAIANASSALSTFILDAPIAGTQKFIRCDGSFGSTAIGYIDAGSGVSISSTQRYMSIKSAYATMHLVGLNTTSWFVVSTVGSTASTGSTA